jgi:hypothetical protein
LILNPKSKHGGSDNFSTDAIYKLHVGADRLQIEGLIYTIRFHAGAATVGLGDHSLGKLGLAGDDVGVSPLNQVTR